MRKLKIAAVLLSVLLAQALFASTGAITWYKFARWTLSRLTGCSQGSGWA